MSIRKRVDWMQGRVVPVRPTAAASIGAVVRSAGKTGLMPSIASGWEQREIFLQPQAPGQALTWVDPCHRFVHEKDFEVGR